MSIQGYEEQSGQVISYVAGLPLTIKVLGSFLCGKSELEWIDVMERLKAISLMETLEKLELSYINLEEDYKEILHAYWKPSEHSRLWIDMEIEDILANDLGTEATRYIQFSTRELNPGIIMKGLRKMKELRYLCMSLKDSFWNWKCDELSHTFLML
ncbi:unnamed protein product [Lactuca saligna]|uniref:NB-ARC domain-containing protein n=1 Tax=Lactuca saligna TaxID=75948 RepID=A0AA35ZY02_LACSI|nr:unnamed protein product [Lactuca saligna]